jgi:acyl dehydratase
MVEDGNPLYVDGEYARNGRYGGVIAPWHSLMIWGMQRAGHMGLDPEAPDPGARQRKAWPPKINEEHGMPFVPPGTTDFVATQTVQEYGPPLRPGDRTYGSSQMVTCSPLRETRLGNGYFITSQAVTRNHRDEIVSTHYTTLLRYSSPSRQA